MISILNIKILILVKPKSCFKQSEWLVWSMLYYSEEVFAQRAKTKTFLLITLKENMLDQI
jgi:hypothetical protein